MKLISIIVKTPKAVGKFLKACMQNHMCVVCTLNISRELQISKSSHIVINIATVMNEIILYDRIVSESTNFYKS